MSNKYNSNSKRSKAITKIIKTGFSFNSLLIIFLMLTIFDLVNSQHKILLKESIVELKVAGSGSQRIFNRGTEPNEIKINGQSNTLQNYYDLNPSDTIQLVWDRDITTCQEMFYGCNSIKEIKFIKFDLTKCSLSQNMFKDCHSLISLDFSGVSNANNITDMAGMFMNCKSLISLDLSNFDTSNNGNFGHFFDSCESLEWINLSNLNTENILYMDYLFNGCKKLTSLDLSNFITSKATNMENMFNNCESLKILNLPNLNIKSGTNINNIFSNCKNLEYINIQNLETYTNFGINHFQNTPNNLIMCISDDKKSLIQNLIDNKECMLISCKGDSYEYKINLENSCFVENCSTTNYKYEYNNTCYNECPSKTYIEQNICKDCHSNCQECEGAFTSDNNNCKLCISNLYYNYGNCINNCSRGNYTNETTSQITCKCELEQCLACTEESKNENLCTSCDTEFGFYPIYDDLNNIYSPYLNCSKSPEGYYFNNTIHAYKLCYSTCKSCNISGNIEQHNCIECKEGLKYEQLFTEYKNCYNICSFYYYFDEKKNKFLCTDDYICPKDYDKLIEEKNECVFNCSKNEFYKYEFRKKCFNECPDNSTERENITKELELISFNKKYFCKPICNESFPYEIIHTQECVSNCEISSILNYSCIVNYQNQEKDDIIIFDSLLKNIEDLFTSNDYDISEIEGGNNNIIKYEEITITLTTTTNQKNEEKNGNVTTINLGDCENILKEVYNISYNETLFIKKIDVEQEGMMIPKIEYDVYYKLNGINLEKLNLSYCKNSKIDISIPLKLNIKDLDKYNASSGYYNDICYTTTSDSGTDIPLKDRITEFIDNNKTLCQENCFLSEYDFNNNIAKCSCDIKESSSLFENIKIDKNKLYENFMDIENILNINILVCYKTLFTKNGLLKNYGSYSLIIIIITHFIFIIIFYVKKLYNEIKEEINKISLCINNLQLLNKGNKPEENRDEIMLKNNKNKELKKKRKRIKRKEKNKIENLKQIELNIKVDYKKNQIRKNNSKQKKNKNKGSLKFKNPIKETLNFPKNKNNINNKLNNENKELLLKKMKKIMKYNDEELNDLEYELAKKYDKRNYCEYYYSLLNTKHAFVFTFFNDTDYNIKLIKIDLFIFNFTLFFVINALFFTDDSIHKIYKEKGDFDIIDQLPQIIYSFLISLPFSMILERLALTEEQILDLKKLITKNTFVKKSKIVINKIKIKFLFYFIISTIFLIFFWYYLAMFCAIYKNTQIHLIKDTLLSFASSFIEPLGIYLIPGLFRIPALSEKNKNRPMLYKFSKILEMILL